MKDKYTELIKEDTDGKFTYFDIEKVPLEPDLNILAFILEHAKNLQDWGQDLIEIVLVEASYFLRQIQTKIMNEGWASFWHYKNKKHNVQHHRRSPSSVEQPFRVDRKH